MFVLYPAFHLSSYILPRIPKALTILSSLSIIYLKSSIKVSEMLRLKFIVALMTFSGPGSIVVIPTGYGLDGPGIESGWGARFSAPVQTGPGAQPASCTMGTGSFPGVKSGQGVTLTPYPLLVPLVMKE